MVQLLSLKKLTRTDKKSRIYEEGLHHTDMGNHLVLIKGVLTGLEYIAVELIQRTLAVIEKVRECGKR